MKKITLNIIFIFCLALCANSAFAQSNNGFEISVDKDTILIGDQIKLTAKVKNSADLRVAFPQLKDTVAQGIELIKELAIDTIRAKNEITEFQKSYIITSFDSGYYAIKLPCLIARGNAQPDTVESNEVRFLVNTIPVDTLTYQMKDIKAPIAYPITFKEVFPWILIVLLAIVLIILGIIFYRRWKKHQPLLAFGKPKPKLPPHILAFKELSLLKSEKLWQQGKVKTYYTKITDIVRVYIGDRFGISTMEKTSDEILNDIKNEKIDQMYSYDKLRNMLYTSDLVKFAKYQPSADENEASFSTAYEFVTATQPQIVEDEKTSKENKKEVDETKEVKEINEDKGKVKKEDDTKDDTKNLTKEEKDNV